VSNLFRSLRLSEHIATFVGVDKSILYAVQRIPRVHLALIWMEAMPPACICTRRFTWRAHVHTPSLDQQAGACCLHAKGQTTYSMLEKNAARKSILTLSDGHAVKKSAAERSPR
jgi:hypothetical protein